MFAFSSAAPVAVAILLALAPASSQSRAAEPAGTIAGRVLDSGGAPVAGVCVVPCEHTSGIPLSKSTMRPFTDEFAAGRQALDLAYAVSDEQGRFRCEKLPAGRYRLVAQSWKDAGPVKQRPKNNLPVPTPEGEGRGEARPGKSGNRSSTGIKSLLEVNGETIELHGVAESVQVPSPAALEVVLRPLGTGVLKLDEKMPNDETLLVISTAPPRADPVLGFVGWGGGLMSKMIGANRMPRGKTTVRGLPQGKVHLVLFAADNSPGWGAGEAEIRPQSTTVAYVPVVAAWSDGHHDPPPRLAKLFAQMQTLMLEKDFSLQQILKLNGVQIKPGRGVWEGKQQIAPHLGGRIELPNGGKALLGDVVAAARYVQLQQLVRQRQEGAKRRAALRKMDSPTAGTPKGSYEQAFRDLYKELGMNYPCFELKGIDWEAAGRELLPRAEKITGDEQFGLLCMELVARLEDSHAALGKGTIDPPSPPLPRWDPGFACLIDDRDRPVVYYVDKDGPAQAAGVRVGATVVSVNGKPAQAALGQCAEQAAKYVGFSSRRYLRYQAARWFTRQTQRGAAVKLQLQDPDGKTRSLELPATCGVRYLPRLPVPIAGISDSANVSWTMLDGNLGYIYVRRIRGDLVERLDRAVGELKGASGLIVDVRGNSGGGFDAGRAHRNFGPADDQEPQRPRFDGPMALLVDARCISAGEGWASWFVARRRARLFGQATAGASARKRTYTLTNKLYKVTFPVKAYNGYLTRPIERRGLEPDVRVVQTAADLAAGRDTVLAAAKKYLANLPSQCAP